MYKLDLTKEKVEEIKGKIYFNERQERILEYRLKDYSITMMARLEHCSESTISREINKIFKKIQKVL